MLSIFSTPKPFRGHIEVIQTNAIRSWTLLRPQCEVILFGNEKGTAEVTARFGIRHIPEVERNEYGTPLVSSLFKIAQDIASYPLMCYVNADIILMSDFLPAISQVKWQSFLLVGQRWDIDLKQPVDFSDPDWEEQLRHRLPEEGKLHAPSGLDYFVFPRGMYRNIPPLAIGRGKWDNWMAYRARSLRVPLIDATKVISAVHQNHDYSHLPGGTIELSGGPETKRNIELMGGPECSFNTEYATWMLTPQGIRRALSLRHVFFRMTSIPVLFPHFHLLRTPIKALARCIMNVRSWLLRLREGK